MDVHGVDLLSVLAAASRTRQHVPLGHVVAIVAAAAAELHHAHARAVHQQISPSTIRIGYDGTVDVIEAGIAAPRDRLAYRAPEQCLGERVDARTDVYALGVVLYELATTTRLFKGDSEHRLAEAIVHGRVPPPRSKRPDLPEELSAIILRAIATDPERRYASADELRVALELLARKLGLASSSAALALFLRAQFGEPPRREVVARPGSDVSAVVRTGTLIAAESGPTAPPSQPAVTGNWQRAPGRRATGKLAAGGLVLFMIIGAGVWRLSASHGDEPAYALSTRVEAAPAPAVAPATPGTAATVRRLEPAPTIVEHMPAIPPLRTGGAMAAEDRAEVARRAHDRAKPAIEHAPAPSPSAAPAQSPPAAAPQAIATKPAAPVAEVEPVPAPAPVVTIPAPPAAPAPAAKNVAPTMLDANRIAGERTITPDDHTQIEIRQRGLDRVLGTYKVCLAATGEPSAVTLIKSTGFLAYDQKIASTIRTQWRYRPYLVDGRPSPVCTAVRFIYTQG